MTLVTRREAAAALGYSYRSLVTLMHRRPDRWPAPAGTRRVGRATALVYHLDQMRAAAGDRPLSSRIGDAASLSDEDGLITCLECGRRMRGLGVHLPRVHGITGDEYRVLHHLPATGALTADVTRAHQSEIHRDMLAADPTMLDHLTAYQTPEHMAEMTAKNRGPVRESHLIPLAQQHRAPGRAYGVQRMAEQRAAMLDATVHAHGYESVDDAIAKTRHLSERAAAAATGLGASTIHRRRMSDPAA